MSGVLLDDQTYLFADSSHNRVGSVNPFGSPWDTQALWITVGKNPRSIAAAQFVTNGVGLDAAVANSGSNSVSVLENGRSGAGSYAVGAQPWQVLAGHTSAAAPAGQRAIDFNGDGNLDVATVDRGSGQVSILLGHGDRTFSSAVNSAAGPDPVAVTAADFNGDGKLDLAVANFSIDSYSILLGNGDGTFQSPQVHALAAGSHPDAIAAADLNADHKPDLVVANSGTNSVSVLFGAGNGSFGAATTYAVGSRPTSLLLQDVDANYPSYDLDIIVTNGASANVSILSGNGDGTFQTALESATGSGPNGVVWYVDPSGNAGLVVSDNGGRSISVLMKQSTVGLSFYPAVRQVVGYAPVAVATADFNHDGNLDLATADSQQNSVSVLLGNGRGGLSAPKVLGTGVNTQPADVVAGDFNGDGKPDLATADPGDGTSFTNSVSVLLGNGDGTFGPARRFTTGTNASLQYYPLALGAADFNGDGKLDLAVANGGTCGTCTPATSPSTLAILFGNGDGTFQPPVLYPTGNAPSALAIRDLGNGHPDVIVGTPNYDLYVFTNKGDGALTRSVDYNASGAVESITTADLNGDGRTSLR